MAAEPQPHVDIDALYRDVKKAVARVQSHVHPLGRNLAIMCATHNIDTDGSEIVHDSIAITRPSSGSDGNINFVAEFWIDDVGALRMKRGDAEQFRQRTATPPRTQAQMLRVISAFIPRRRNGD